MEKYFIPQIMETDCGFACLKIMLAIVKKDTKYLYIKQDESKKSFNYQELSNLAASYGMNVCGMATENKNDIRTVVNFPFIASIKEFANTYHAVVVRKVTRHRVKVIDPAKGYRSIPLKKFINMWDGSCMMIEKLYQYPVPETHTELPKSKKPKISLFMEVISYLLLGLGIFFIDEKYHFMIPVSLLVGFMITSVTQKVILMRSMHEIDTSIIEMARGKNLNHGKFIKRLSNYKKQLFSIPTSIVSNLLVCLFLMSILIINSVKNTILVSVPLAFAAIDLLVFNPIQEEKAKLIARREKETIWDKDEHFVDSLKLVQTKSYEIANFFLVKRYCFIFLMVLTAFLTMWFTSTHVTLAYTIFYFSIEMILYEYFSNLLSYKQKKLLYLRAKMKLINIINEK